MDLNFQACPGIALLPQLPLTLLTHLLAHSGVPRGVGGLGFNPPPRNSEVLTKLSRIPSSVENTSVTTLSEYGFHSFPD
jgi:hypothetical protein